MRVYEATISATSLDWHWELRLFRRGMFRMILPSFFLAVTDKKTPTDFCKVGREPILPLTGSGPA